MRAWASLVLLVGCVPPIPSIEGKACDQQHLCGQGYVCLPPQCRPPAPGTTQLIVNGDFEAGGGASGWYNSGNSLIESQQTTIHGGQWAGRAWVQSSTAGSYFGLNVLKPTGQTLEDGASYCAEAWVLVPAVAAGEAFKFYIRKWNAAGDFEDVTVSAGAGSGWQQLAARTVLAPPFNAAIGVRFSTEAFPGGEYFADDVMLWQDTAGSICTREDGGVGTR